MNKNTQKLNSPIYIVGVGRSGTSLIQSIFNSHSLYSFPPETGLLRRFIVNKKINVKLLQKSFKDGILILDNDKNFQRVNIKSIDLINHCLGKENNKDITEKDIYIAMLELNAKKDNKYLYGDKDPRSIEILSSISRMFDSVNIIHIIRDPRDVLLSKKKAEWSKKRHSLFHIFINRLQMDEGLSQGVKLFGKDYHQIFYEELIQYPETILKSLCKKIKIPFEPSMLNFNKNAKKIISNEELSWKKETLGPLLTNNFNKWDGKLHIWEIAITELVCFNNIVLEKYSLSNAFSKLNIISKLIVYKISLLIIFASIIYRIFNIKR